MDYVLANFHFGHGLFLLVSLLTIWVMQGRVGGTLGLFEIFQEQPEHASRIKNSRWYWIILSPSFTSMAMFSGWAGLSLHLLGVSPNSLQVIQYRSAAAWFQQGGTLFLVFLFVLSSFALLFGHPKDSRWQLRERGRSIVGMVAGIVASLLIVAFFLPMLTYFMLSMQLSATYATTFSLLILAAVASVIALRQWVQTCAAWFLVLIILTVFAGALAARRRCRRQ